MIRFSARKATFVAMAALLVGGAVMSCSTSKKNQSQVDPERVGSISLAVLLSSGAELNSVTYTVSGNGITPITGAIDTTGQSTTVSVIVSGIPAGTGYLVEMTGTSTDGKTNCAGSATFDVQAGQQSAVTVGLQCRTDSTTGSVGIIGELNACPVVTSFVVAPVAVDAGGKIAVASSTSDSDAGSTLSYAWTATGGTFEGASSASTSFNCTAPGPQTLTLTVSDGKCESTASAVVTCVPVSCGNGTVETDKGEDCDPPDGVRCSTNCKFIVTCGDGITDPGECEPPGTATCTDQCTTRAPVCGDGFVTAPEACEPPNTETCSATCTSITPPECGNGVVEAGEECDAPSLPTETCTADCKTIVVESACDKCVREEPNCPTDVVGCAGLTGEDKTLCEAVFSCMDSGTCVDRATGDASPCYCGTAAGGACLGAGAANGACKAQVEAAAKSTDAETIAGRFVDPTYPLGHASLVFGCRAAFCAAPCGL